MNFPDEPFFRIVHWIVNTPTLGGIIVLSVGAMVLVGATLTLYWIILGAQAEENEVYTYPTPALLGHGKHKSD